MDESEWPPTTEANDDSGPRPLIKSSKEFVAGFFPPDYLVNGTRSVSLFANGRNGRW
jgi:hypothetical protein